jgi:predicted NBD/HSP70 family sugar kinase
MNPNRMLEFASTGQSTSLHDDTVLSYDSGEAFGMKHVPTIKERDRALITDVVRRFGPLSRVKLHELTHFRPATIGAVVRELLDEGVLAEGGLSNNPTGRKQILLELNEKLGYVVTLDFDAETVSAGMMDVRAKLRNSVIRESTDLANGRDGLLRQLLSCVERTIQQAGPESGRPLGIGIGDPGLVNSQEGISVVSSTIDFWHAIKLRELFNKAFGVPVVVSDNTRTKAIAERTLGAGEGAADLIYIEYGTGIGAGIFTGGHLLQGHRWSAGEFGHTSTTEGGPPCRCGSFGCLEAVAGLAALETRVRSALRNGGFSRCLELAGRDIDRVTGWHVLETAALGDKMCVVLVEELARSLGFGIANLVNIFNPEIIVLDHRLKLAGPEFLHQLTRVVQSRALAYVTETLRFRFGELGSDAALLGAGLMSLDAFFAVPALKPPKFMVGTETSLASLSS